MKDINEKSLDILGIKPIADSIKIVVKASVEGAAAFLSRICLPAAEEFGLLLKDKVSFWRSQNLVRMTEKAEKKLELEGGYEGKHMSPRLLSLIVEHSSWIDIDDVQEMWAGLLVSSCTEDGRDEGNIIFINLLSQLTTAQAKILNYACKKAQKKLAPAGWVVAETLTITLEDIQRISGVEDFQRLDRELDHLRALNLIDEFSGGFQRQYSTKANITPSALGLHLFVKCQGSRQSTVDYFGLAQKSKESEDNV